MDNRRDREIDSADEFEFTIIRPEKSGNIWSDELKIIFILKGGGWLYIEGTDMDYPVGQGDIFVINSFQVHSMELDSRALAISLNISPSFLAAVSPDTAKPYINCRSFLHGKEEQTLFDLLRRDFALAFRAKYKNESPLSIHLRTRVTVLLDDLLMNFLEPEKQIHNTPGSERLRAAIDYIHRHYRENITLADLSGHTFLSPSYLSRSFQKYMGISFLAYLTRVRLLHGAGLLQGNNTITDIAYECGFPSANAFIDAFKQYHGMTPGHYRKTVMQRPDNKTEEKYENGQEEFSTAFVSLMKYAHTPDRVNILPASGVCEVKADIHAVQKQLNHSWRKLINAGYARALLDGSVQRQIEMLQKDVGFAYIRCKGVLDDDMVVYTYDVNGSPSFNYVYIDEAVDFILSVNAKPMLELGHMPAALAKSIARPFRRPSILSPPKNISLWKELIGKLMEHFIKRYGLDEVKKWLFTPWMGPDLSIFGFFTMEEYQTVYQASYQAVKNACRDFKICAPGTNIYSGSSMKRFLQMCREEDCMPDILTLRSYGTINPEDEGSGLKLQPSNEAFYVAVSGNEEYLAYYLKKIKTVIREQGARHLPVMLDEWSSNVWQRDLCNDTSYKSAYIFKSTIDNWDSFYGMGYYNITDRLDEIAPSPELFHGGFGLFLHNGIPKSAYRAMELLKQAGDKLLSKGDGYFITKSEEKVQVFLYNYCHYDMLYRYRNTTKLTKTQRYKVFNEKQPRSYHIRLSGFIPGRRRIKRYSIGPGGGSTFDSWIAMGAPEQMTKEEERILIHLSYPVYRTETVDTADVLELKACLVPHEVQLIVIDEEA